MNIDQEMARYVLGSLCEHLKAQGMLVSYMKDQYLALLPDLRHYYSDASLFDKEVTGYAKILIEAIQEQFINFEEICS